MSGQVRDVKQGTYGLEGLFDFGLFNATVSVSVDAGGNEDYANRCAEFANSFSSHVIDKLCEASIRYCHDSLERSGEPQIQFDQPQDVLKIVRPSVLIVPALPSDSDPIFHMELNCDWEEEHGMEWIVCGSQVRYVGPFSGHDPTRHWSEGESWNYA